MTIDGVNADVPMAASTTCHHTETVCVDCIDTWSIDYDVTVATVAYIARMDVVLRARATSDRMRAMNDRRVMRGTRPATRARRTGAGAHAR
ncbi:hypothetical protein GTE7_gp094 [Gordonia phage GTE7]|uniref:Uncharacterized protein n=1 Tax=Gordonia phage GTE7 TaxID=1100814 RepID=G8FS87_9CAUD|nr:hypothetical protein GTE7_gp094 [Gordonia phage GTE7]AER26637.1 hypothetical protein [Gordonia phage GTE7]